MCRLFIKRRPSNSAVSKQNKQETPLLFRDTNLHCWLYRLPITTQILIHNPPSLGAPSLPHCYVEFVLLSNDSIDDCLIPKESDIFRISRSLKGNRHLSRRRWRPPSCVITEGHCRQATEIPFIVQCSQWELCFVATVNEVVATWRVVDSERCWFRQSPLHHYPSFLRPTCEDIRKHWGIITVMNSIRRPSEHLDNTLAVVSLQEETTAVSNSRRFHAFVLFNLIEWSAFCMLTQNVSKYSDKNYIKSRQLWEKPSWFFAADSVSSNSGSWKCKLMFVNKITTSITCGGKSMMCNQFNRIVTCELRYNGNHFNSKWPEIFFCCGRTPSSEC